MAESMFVLMPIPVISWRMALKMVTTGRALQPQQGLDGLPTAPRQLWNTASSNAFGCSSGESRGRDCSFLSLSLLFQYHNIAGLKPWELTVLELGS